MKYYEVSPVGIVRQDSAVFTYSSDTPIAIGSIVEIEVGKKHFTGVVLASAKKPPYTTKPIIRVIEGTPLPSALLKLALWLSQYYTTHLGTVWQTILPRGVQKSRRDRESSPHIRLRDRTHFVLNKMQSSAVENILSMAPGSAILHGVTGSGKTAVYIETTRQMLAKGKSVIILTPEIGLTPQIVDDFSQHFENILVTHSRQTEAQRHATWKQALTAISPQIIIGPRSALFVPIKNVGLIVIDEAHEPSYKQEQSPRYSALRAASVLAANYEAKLILGSATPLVTDFFTAAETKRPIITMSSPAKKTLAPNVTLVDMTRRTSFRKHRFFSDQLLKNLEETFSDGKQALIFHNRRGSASITLCDVCGWQAVCERCHIPLTLHADTHQLRCHVCGQTDSVPTSCPSCNNADIVHKGIGTKLIESEIQKLFPNIKVARFDGDNNHETSIATKYKELYDGDVQLLIGTQVVAKGLDLPHLRSVGIIQADAGLSLPDYSSSERTFQLLAQAVGRVGRSEHATNVVVQSYQPEHPAVKFGLNQDYESFYKYTLKERQQGKYPPYRFILKLICTYKTEAAAIRNTQKVATTLKTHMPDIEVLGPAPSFYEKQRDTYRWQLIVKSPQRGRLTEALQHVPQANWQSELDPVTLL